MVISPETIDVEKYLKDKNARHTHRKNADFLRLAITNIKLSEELKIKEGLTYDCSDDFLFKVFTPRGERVFRQICTYEYPESRFVVASNYVFLKNKWIEKSVDIEKVIVEVSKAYEPLTYTLNSRFIRDGLLERSYSRKLFSYDKSNDVVRPVYLPVSIEL